MNAALQNTGHTQTRDSQEVRQYPRPGVKVYTFFAKDPRTPEERRADLDREARSLGVSARCFI